MKISIDTIPLWDAFRQTSMCPFCFIQNKLEELYIDTYLGDSVMEPDVRIEVNAKGFCRDHFRLLYYQKAGKLGLALMTHTHLLQTISGINAQIDALDRRCEEGSMLKRMAGTKDMNSLLDETAAQVEKKEASCVVCERVDIHMLRYHETALHMWEHDSDFKTLFEQSGFCIPHWAAQLHACKALVSTKKNLQFIKKLNEMQKKALADMANDIEWFTKKFDYRNTNQPWANSKDALPRSLNMLKGYTIPTDS